MKRAALLSTVAITAAIFGENGEALAQCITTTDCASLGYTETSCTDGGLKCPFGNTWSCKETAPTEPATPTAVVLGECNGYAANCNIADIFNSDGTCTSDVTPGKSPLGVVIAIKDNCGWAMTASPIATNIAWAVEATASISSGATQTSDQITIMRDYDACGNTQRITQQGRASLFPAAEAAVNYAPAAAPETKGKWCLPSAGILISLRTKTEAIDNSISKLGGMSLIGSKNYIWSSSEEASNRAWILWLTSSSGISLGHAAKYPSHESEVVYPVLQF